MFARWSRLALPLSIGLSAMACATPGSDQPELSLVGPEWRVLYFRSSDDAVGIVRPAPRETYTLDFRPDGTVAAQLACNKGSGRWRSPDASRARGSLEIRRLTATMRGCLDGDLARFPSDLGRVTSFVIADGRLNLNLEADAGDYVLAPVGAAQTP